MRSEQDNNIPHLDTIREGNQIQVVQLPQQFEVPSIDANAYTLEVLSTVQNLVNIIPEGLIQRMNENVGGRHEIVRQELYDCARTIVDFQLQKERAPVARDFLSTPRHVVSSEEKTALATKSLRSMIATCVVGGLSNKSTPESLKHQIGLATNELRFFIGQHGDDIVIGAINQLSEVERTLLLSSMSALMCEQLGYPDIDFCDEERMSHYLRRVTQRSTRNRSYIDEAGEVPMDSIDNVGSLLDACIERSRHNLRVVEVISTLLKHQNHKQIFKQMIEIANHGDYLDQLALFFDEHSDTRPYARRCHQMMEDHNRYR